jgi:hypothetical protein
MGYIIENDIYYFGINDTGLQVRLLSTVDTTSSSDRYTKSKEVNTFLNQAKECLDDESSWTINKNYRLSTTVIQQMIEMQISQTRRFGSLE